MNHQREEERFIILKDTKKNFKLIDESYNANPISVKNAIQKLIQLKNKILKNIYYSVICLN